MSIWNEQQGPDNDVVISSRVRLARNVSGYPYTNSADEQILLNIMEIASKAISGMTQNLGLKFIDLNKTTKVDRYCFVERHLMSPDMLEGSSPGALILNKDESLSVMVNEEDHLRMQTILPGLQLETVYKMCNDFEERLGEKINYDFDEQFGYLTSCPTNLGTGLRVSAMMHLPALVESGYIKKILEACGKMGVAVRGVYGEGSAPLGNIFQISNQVSLGHNEEEIIQNTLHTVNQIMEKERGFREGTLNSNKLALEDKVFRAYGVLANVRKISAEEAMNLMSWVRLGIDMNIIDFINPVNMNALLVSIQAGTVQKEAGMELTPQQRDEKRAELCRKKLEREVI